MIGILLIVFIFFNIFLLFIIQKDISQIIEVQQSLAEKELECELYKGGNKYE